jgi:hypothetical protein
MTAPHDEFSPWIGGEARPPEPEPVEPWGDLHAPPVRRRKASATRPSLAPSATRFGCRRTGSAGSSAWPVGLVAVFLALAVAAERVVRADFARLRHASPWLIAVAFALGAWVLAATFAGPPHPFFPPH